VTLEEGKLRCSVSGTWFTTAPTWLGPCTLFDVDVERIQPTGDPLVAGLATMILFLLPSPRVFLAGLPIYPLVFSVACLPSSSHGSLSLDLYCLLCLRRPSICAVLPDFTGSCRSTYHPLSSLCAALSAPL